MLHLRAKIKYEPLSASIRWVGPSGRRQCIYVLGNMDDEHRRFLKQRSFSQVSVLMGVGVMVAGKLHRMETSQPSIALTLFMAGVLITLLGSLGWRRSNLAMKDCNKEPPEKRPQSTPSPYAMNG